MSNKKLTLTIPDNSEAQTDWLAGTSIFNNNQYSTTPSVVTLQHVLSKITIKVKASDAEIFTVNNVTLTNIEKGGTIDITYASPVNIVAKNTTESDEYTGPIDMPRGKNVFSVILVDESGMCSEVVENIYKYEDCRY